jgi:hypothetical protein
MSLVGTVANYGGRQPDNTQNIKQFVIGTGNEATWVYQKLTNGLLVQTPADKTRPVYINSDLYVNGSIYNTSDVILKENIVSINNEQTNKVLALNPVEYSLKSDMLKRTHYGFLAQDVEKIYPELVKTSNFGLKTVNYIELLPIMLSKMKDMQEEIDELKSIIKKEIL